jgi:hypothetical protein
MLSVTLAAALRRAGMPWSPAPGDHFVIPDRDIDDQQFVISDMTIEVHDLPSGQLLGFNGTTEWALDDVEKDEVLWLPREDQLREMLDGAFLRLERVTGGYRVVVTVDEVPVEIRSDRVEDAYASALLYRLTGDSDPKP